MRTVGAYEAKTHLPRLLDAVEKGERSAEASRSAGVALVA